MLSTFAGGETGVLGHVVGGEPKHVTDAGRILQDVTALEP